MPGFNDAHCHLASGGFQKMNVDLVGARSLQEMQQRIGLRANKAAAGEWILGEGWDHTLWPEQKLPTRQDMDVVTNGHPAIFVRVDGHIAVANTRCVAGGGNHRQRHRHRRVARSTSMPRESRRALCASRRRGWCSPRCRRRRRRSARGSRTGAGRCRALGSDLGAGQLGMGGVSGLRRAGARRQTDAAHQRVAATSAIPWMSWRSTARIIRWTIRCCTPRC